MADLLPQIETNAANPRSASNDGTMAQQHSLPDQIAADKYAKSAGALSNRPLGIRYVGLRAPAASDIDLGNRGQ